MEKQEKSVMIVVDGYTRVMLTIIAILLTVVAVGMWSASPSMTSQAQAKGLLPDQGLQLDDIKIGIDKLNETMDRVASVLVSGEVRVQVLDSDKAENKK